MGITTIKLREKTKMALDSVKEEQETYDEAVLRLITASKKTGLKQALIEGYKNFDKKEFEEWNKMETDWPE